MDERRPRISEAHFNGAGKPSLIGLPPQYRVDYRYSCHNVEIPITDHQSGLLFFQLGLFSTGNIFRSSIICHNVKNVNTYSFFIHKISHFLLYN